jgi:hypothetical protein
VQSWGIDIGDGPSTPLELWTREESLATVVAAEFVELPEVMGEGETKDESFVGRLIRQIGDARVRLLPKKYTSDVAESPLEFPSLYCRILQKICNGVLQQPSFQSRHL